MDYMPIENQLADIFTMSLSKDHYCKIIQELGMLELSGLHLHFLFNIYS